MNWEAAFIAFGITAPVLLPTLYILWRWGRCWVGLHSWRKTSDQLGCYGMGLEWFECWECEYCEATADRVRGGGSYQVHPTRER